MTHPTLARLMAQTARLLENGGADRWLSPAALERARALTAATLRNLPVQAGPLPGSLPGARLWAGAAAGDVVDVEAREVDRVDIADDPRVTPRETRREAPGGGPVPAAARPGADAAGAADAAASPAAATADAAAAPGAAAPARWVDGRFDHPVRALEYRLHVPAGADDAGAAPRPLVLMLHGCTQDPRDFAAGTAMHVAAGQAFVLYPAQSARANPQRCWNWFKPHHQQRGRGEALLLAALVQHVAARYPVDSTRIAVAGLSAGGAMAAVLGQAYPELFGAVGVHSGLPAGAAADLPSALAAMRGGPGRAAPALPAVPTIVFHGDADTTVHPSNGRLGAAAGANAGGAGGGAQAGATGGGAGERLVSAQGMRYTRRLVAAGDGAPGHEEWVVHGAGHAWSGGAAAGSYTLPAGPDASAAMWDFFVRAWRAARR